jgi:hypothetical protein
MYKILIPFLSIVLIYGCSSPGSDGEKSYEDSVQAASEIQDLNTPAPGFNVEESDAIAIITADKVMKAMGGKKAWDNTRYIKWNFFGLRKLLWDKETGNVRIEIPRDSLTVLMNVNEMTGRVQKGSMEVTDSLDYYLDMGKKIWINDSYWLVMPFKLKDSGVTLTYIGESQTLTGDPANLLQLTFDNVGVTPDNKYQVWVSNETNLVSQWAYFPNAEDDEPRFTLPWGDYKQKGEILLSGERGDRDLTEIEVYEDLSEDHFTDFEATIPSGDPAL